LDSNVMQNPQEARQQTTTFLRYNSSPVDGNFYTNHIRMIRRSRERVSSLEPSLSNEIQRRIGNQQRTSPSRANWTTARQMYISNTIEH
jgi:hypothetical protein